MEEKSIAYELLQEVKKTNKRLFIICIIELILIVATNAGWIYYNTQFETVSEHTTVEGGENGVATYLENSESGDINYGKDNKD